VHRKAIERAFAGEGGDSWLTCNYVIGDRRESTDKKTSLESALREFGIVG
jgi:hypothetical protein